MGDNKTPLLFLILASFLNIVLDLVFIIVFRMEYIDTGLATVISQLISGLLCLIYMLKKFDNLRPQKIFFRTSVCIEDCWASAFLLLFRVP